MEENKQKTASSASNVNGKPVKQGKQPVARTKSTAGATNNSIRNYFQVPQPLFDPQDRESVRQMVHVLGVEKSVVGELNIFRANEQSHKLFLFATAGGMSSCCTMEWPLSVPNLGVFLLFSFPYIVSTYIPNDTRAHWRNMRGTDKCAVAIKRIFTQTGPSGIVER